MDPLGPDRAGWIFFDAGVRLVCAVPFIACSLVTVSHTPALTEAIFSCGSDGWPAHPVAPRGSGTNTH